jgi:hypothetical protein
MRNNRKVDYNQVDWSLSNSEIAKEWGVCTKTIGSARRRRGLPNPKKGFGQGNPNPSNRPWQYSPAI